MSEINGRPATLFVVYGEVPQFALPSPANHLLKAVGRRLGDGQTYFPGLEFFPRDQLGGVGRFNKLNVPENAERLARRQRLPRPRAASENGG